jgi:sortase A
VGHRRITAGVTSRVALIAALCGFSLVIQGAWIPIKARLAQHLIARAWQEVADGDKEARPWPWADTWPVAKLRLPRKEDPLYVLAGASGESLAFGPAHISASAHPGTADNVAIAGHRDTHFAPLENLIRGDEVLVETATSSTRYRVEEVAVVHESRVDLLERTGRAELTLITCYPFDAIVPGGPLRYVVHASAIDEPVAQLLEPVAPRPNRRAGWLR